MSKRIQKHGERFEWIAGMDLGRRHYDLWSGLWRPQWLHSFWIQSRWRGKLQMRHLHRGRQWHSDRKHRRQFLEHRGLSKIYLDNLLQRYIINIIILLSLLLLLLLSTACDKNHLFILLISDWFPGKKTSADGSSNKISASRWF